MSGSSTILQALLPGRSGDVAQRNGLQKKSEQSFATVFEKKLQVRRDKPLPLTAAENRDRNQPVAERREPDHLVDGARKPERPAVKNPAKEKMKELVKKAKDALEAMKDPEATPGQLKELAGELKEIMAELREMSEALKTEGEQEGLPENGHPGDVIIAQMVPETQPHSGTPGTAAEGESETAQAGIQPTAQTTEPPGRLQTQTLKENLTLKDFQEILTVQADLLAEDPELKEVLKQILGDVQAVLNSETQHETKLTEDLGMLFAKLNGTAVNVETTETEAPKDQDTAQPAGDEITAAAVQTSSAGSQEQQAASEESSQDQNAQGKQLYGTETPAGPKNPENGEQPRTTGEKPVTGTEKTDSAAVKPAPSGNPQAVPNPQAFQDALDAVKESVQAKTQFQSRIMEQVVETIKMNVKGDDGKTEMLMKLKPESLGNVALKVSIDKGIVMAELQVESQAVKQALESNLQDLRSALQDKGFNVFDLDVSVRKDNQQQNNDSGKSAPKGTARVEAKAERLEQRLMSLEASYHQSTIDYLG